VGSRVDPAGHSAYHGPALGRQIARKLAGELPCVLRWSPASDKRDGILQRDVFPCKIKQQRSVRDLAQRIRVVYGTKRDQANAGFRAGIPDSNGPVGGIARRQRFDGFPDYSLPAPSRHARKRRSAMRKAQAPKMAGRKPLHQAQAQKYVDR
jgi:hypothetical protein